LTNISGKTGEKKHFLGGGVWTAVYNFSTTKTDAVASSKERVKKK